MTNDAAIAEAARILRFHGSYDKVTYEEIGYNSRLDDLQAAILRVLLPHLDSWAAGRVAAGRHYGEAGLGELVTLPTPDDRRLARLAPLRDPPPRGRPAGRGAERARGSAARPTTARPCTSRRRWRTAAQGVSLPATEAVAADHLAIPMQPRARHALRPTKWSSAVRACSVLDVA